MDFMKEAGDIAKVIFNSKRGKVLLCLEVIGIFRDYIHNLIISMEELKSNFLNGLTVRNIFRA